VKLPAFSIAMVFATSLYGQYGGHRFSWQESCFNHPGLPYCQGNEYAVKPTPPPKNGGKIVVTDPVTGKPVVVSVTGIDWRFADPAADGVAGIDVAKLMASPIAHDLVADWAAMLGFSQPEVEKLFESLLGVDQLAISVRDGKAVVMLTGRATAWRMASGNPDWKSAPGPGGTLLFGDAGSVDQALERLKSQAPAASGQKVNEPIWAVLSRALLGPQEEKAGVERITVSVAMSDRLSIDSSYELSAPADKQAWPASMPGATVDGNGVHWKSSVEAPALEETLARLGSDPAGRSLGALAGVARSLPTNQPAPIDHSKPVIYGLDDGPRQLNR
jgi:hypothetical protein